MLLHKLKIEYYGDDGKGWSGSIEDDGTSLEMLLGDNLKPCPFCGLYDLELCNTHTASYWISCTSCGCELHDCGASGKTPKSHSAAVRTHRASIRSVIQAWQARA